MGLNEDPTVWHINSNNNRFFTGEYSAAGLEDPSAEHANFMFYDKVIRNNITEIIKKENTDKSIDIALGSKKTTEMIRLDLKSYPDTLDLSLKTGNRSAIRAAFYSAAYLLQRALADKLDIQPDEIEICEKLDDNQPYPSIYLSDALPNGAGIVSHLFEDGKLEDLIKRIITFDTFDAIKTPKAKCFMQSIISKEHMEKCVTSCPKCLQTYNNRGFHHILDWRLGVGILRLMLDETHDFGFDDKNRDKYEELSDMNIIMQACAKKYNLTTSTPDQMYWIDGNGLCTVIYHPLWNKRKVLEHISAFSSLRMFNTFKVLRSDLTEDKDNNVQKTYQTAHTNSVQGKLKKNKQPKQVQQRPTQNPAASTTAVINNNVDNNASDDEEDVIL